MFQLQEVVVEVAVGVAMFSNEDAECNRLDSNFNLKVENMIGVKDFSERIFFGFCERTHKVDDCYKSWKRLLCR